MRVERLHDDLLWEYDQYLLSYPISLLYQSTRFKNFLCDLLGCQDDTLVVTDNGRIEGILPLMSARCEAGTVYNSLPYYGSNGGILTTSRAGEYTLSVAYRELATAGGTLASTLIENPFHGEDAEVIPHTHTSQRISQFTDLKPLAGKDWEGMLGQFDASARRNVKKAQSQGVTVEIDPAQMERLYAMHHENMTAIGAPPKTPAFFEAIPRHFRPGEDYNLYVARQDGAVIAALLVFYFNRTAEYYVPAIDSDHRSTQPLPLIAATAMFDAIKRGLECWNWGGTHLNQTGVYRFKRKWAASERYYRYYTYVNDKTILRWPPSKFGQLFPNFFVVPFDALENPLTPSPLQTAEEKADNKL